MQKPDNKSFVAIETPDYATPPSIPYTTGGKAWIITFADLMALMLAFFVMLFSMSSMQTKAWLSIVTGLSDRLSPGHEVTVIGETVNARPLRVLEPKGIDLGYLAAVLTENLGRHPILKNARIILKNDRVSILLPPELLFEKGSATPLPTAALALRAAGDALRSVKNRIEIHVYCVEAPIETPGELIADDDPFASGLALALTRAVVTSKLIKDAGLARAPIPAGHAISANDRPQEIIELVIREMGAGGQ